MGPSNDGNCCVTPHDWPLDKRAICQGIPLPGVQLRIRDPATGRDARPGEIGEIEVKGYLTKGYLGDSAQFNASVFTSDGYFRTADLGSLQQDGTLRYAGRSSEMIKRSGINVSPAEVEEILQQHPAVALAGVTGLAGSHEGRAHRRLSDGEARSQHRRGGDPRALPPVPLALQGAGSGARLRDIAADVDWQVDAARTEGDGGEDHSVMTSIKWFSQRHHGAW